MGERGAEGPGGGERSGGRGAGREGSGQRAAGPTEGSQAPDFELETLYPSEQEKAKAAKMGSAPKYDSIKLSSLKGEKPVALIFGSYT